MRWGVVGQPLSPESIGITPRVIAKYRSVAVAKKTHSPAFESESLESQWQGPGRTV